MNIFKLANRFELFLVANIGDYGGAIRGEWWIDPYGESQYADQDVGDVGHEILALDSMLDKEAILEGLREIYDYKLETVEIDQEEYDELVKELELYENDEYGASGLYFNLSIPDSVGSSAAGGIDKWKAIKKDCRLAYVKYDNAILVLNNSFSLWKWDENTFKKISNFIWEQIGESKVGKSAEIELHELSTEKLWTVSLRDFLNLDHAHDLNRI